MLPFSPLENVDKMEINDNWHFCVLFVPENIIIFFSSTFVPVISNEEKGATVKLV